MRIASTMSPEVVHYRTADELAVAVLRLLGETGMPELQHALADCAGI